MERRVARLVGRETLAAEWPRVPAEVVNRFPLIVLLAFPWPEMLDRLVAVGIAGNGPPPTFSCRDCYYGVPLPVYRVGALQQGHCTVGCERTHCRPFSRASRDGADRFFVEYAGLLFGAEVSPEVLAATAQRILSLEEDAFVAWFEQETERVFGGPDEAGRAWLLRMQLSFWWS